jgi:hypothetical protein
MRYASGFASGIVALVAAAIVAWGVLVSAPYRETYREFGGELPAITRLALSPGWIFGLAAGLVLAAIGLNLTARLSERSRAIALATLAVLALGLAIGTAYAGVYPIAQLSGNISAD